MEIWTKGTRFRVRDDSGRTVAAILGDLSQSRGLGEAPASMEDIMDVWSQSYESSTGVTELYGDLATGKGLVYRRGLEPWPIGAETLAPAAGQIIAGEIDEQLEPRRLVIRLGRPSTEYHGFMEEEEQGILCRNEVTRVISPPYLLFSHVHDSRNAAHYYIREVVSLVEGVVVDSDLSPP